MAVTCNTALSLSSEALRDKKRLAGDAGVELLAAASDVFKAAELSEHGDNPGSVGVYLASADAHLHQVSALLAEVAALLSTGTLTAGTRDWYQRLDYERLYAEGVSGGEIPAGRELWSEFIAVLVAGGPLDACHAFIRRVTVVIDLLACASPLTMVQSAIVELSVWARHGAYVNIIEPLDESKTACPR